MECVSLINKALEINPNNENAKIFKKFIEKPLKECDDLAKSIEVAKIKSSEYEPDVSLIEQALFTLKGVRKCGK